MWARYTWSLLLGGSPFHFVFEIVLEVWVEVVKLIRGGLTDHYQNTERNVRAVEGYVYLQPSYLHTIS